MKIILEYKVFDLLKNSENEIFLDKVKKENPDLYIQFLNIVGNKGLDVAKQKYNFYDPEVKKEREKKEKEEKLRKKRLGVKKLRELADEELLLKHKDIIEEIETKLFFSYLPQLASKIEKDPRISKYLKHLKAKRVIKNDFKNFIKSPKNFKFDRRVLVNLDTLYFITRYYNRSEDKYDNVSIIKIGQYYVLDTKELKYSVNFKLYDHENNSYFIPKIDKEKDRQFLSDRNTYIRSLDQTNLSKEELNDIVFNKLSNALDENSYMEWEIKQMSNKFNI